MLGRPLRTPVRLFAVLHRRLERTEHFLASPFRLEVFGTPLVCRVVPMSGRQLYDKLYRRFYRFFSQRTVGSDGRCGGAPTSRPEPKAGPRPQEAPSASSHVREEAYGNWGGRSPWDGGSAMGDRGEEGEDEDEAEYPYMGTSEDELCPLSVRATSLWVAAGEVNRWGFR